MTGGFLKSWAADSVNWKLTVLLADHVLQFRNLQKEAQRSFITLPDLQRPSAESFGAD